MFWWGLDEKGKEVQRACKAAGADRKQLRRWLKTYKKVRKNVAPVTNHYHRVRDDANRILAEARELEQMLIEYEQLPEDRKQRFGHIMEDFAATEPKMDFEFILSRADTEFHSTLTNLCRLGPDYLAGNADPILLQSEVENLVGMTREGLEKEKPDLFALACFYLHHNDREIEELSYSMRLERVEEVYQEEFADPILPLLEQAYEKGSLFMPDKMENREKAEFYLKKLTTI